MKDIELTSLLGLSILSDKLNNFMDKFDLNTNPELQLDEGGKAYNTDSDNDKTGIFLSFNGYYRYEREFGEPSNRFTDSENELFLNEITIDNGFSKTKEPTIFNLPFGLQLGDSKEQIISKLGKKPYEKSFLIEHHCWWTRFDDYRILTALNTEFNLIWVRIIKLTEYEKEKIRLKKFLGQQNKNIEPKNQELILELISAIPTNLWKQRKKEGDEYFTDKGINSVETLMIEYLKTLAGYTSKKKATNIYNSVKKVVLSLNKINDMNDYFIETMEREELCEFINDAVRRTGIQINPELDLTEEWRNW